MNAELVKIDYNDAPNAGHKFHITYQSELKCHLTFLQPQHLELALRIFTGSGVEHTKYGSELQAVLITTSNNKWIRVQSYLFVIDERLWSIEVLDIL